MNTYLAIKYLSCRQKLFPAFFYMDEDLKVLTAHYTKGIDDMGIRDLFRELMGDEDRPGTGFENSAEEGSVEDDHSILIEKLNHAITIQKISITDLSTDAIVNADNASGFKTP